MNTHDSETPNKWKPNGSNLRWFRMTWTCTACGKESEKVYRCTNCGKDLVTEDEQRAGIFL